MTQPNAPLWPDGPTLEQAPGVFPMGTDSILLAAFAQLGPRDRLLDLGTGTGLLPLLLLWDKPQATAAAVELSPDACQLARRNFQCKTAQIFLRKQRVQHPFLIGFFIRLRS